ncbi:MAG TPA: phosphoadenylyl-sulfate reductase [Gammaproteobacteria bacterium]|nr:phosphoadenylyl-sulfate reductase [Gammaproteobacteria bacterium]
MSPEETMSPKETMSPEDVLKKAFAAQDKITISFSGAEDVVLIDMACNISEEVNVFSLDTGRLHPETYRFIEDVREHYGVEIDILSPDAEALSAFVKEKGLFSFYEDGHTECCGIRKIEPLSKHLKTHDAWITGQRQDQSPTRSELPQVQVDTAFSDDRRDLMKYNPLSDWTSTQVWQYIRANEVPYNPLHDQGYLSIGCQPCTRTIGPNEHERAGRWWWEEATKRECGLHIINIEEDS